MKKKGLIISTVVMVVVLIAALTTATFAWFTTESRTEIDKISIETANAADIEFGAKADNSFGTQTVTRDNFVFGTLEWATGTWTGTKGLSTTALDTGIDSFLVQKAIATGTPNTDTNGKIDEEWQYGGTIVKANGNGAGYTAATQNTIEAAKENEDYLHIVLGIKAVVPTLQEINCIVTINPTDTENTTIGMSAAIHVQYRVRKSGADVDVTNATWHDVDIYGEDHYGTAKTSITNDTENPAKSAINGGTLNPGSQYTKIEVAKDTKIGNTSTDIYILELRIFMSGNDEDCVNGALGSKADIYINFTTVKPGP